MNNFIEFTPSKIHDLREAYDEAVRLKSERLKSEVFVVDGNEYLTKYAKYLLEYLEGRLSDK